MCVHVEGDLSGCCCVGMDCCGFAFVPGGLGSVSLHERGAAGCGHACVCAQTHVGRTCLSAQATGIHVYMAWAICCLMQALETWLLSYVPDLLGDLKQAAFPLWSHFPLLYTGDGKLHLCITQSAMGCGELYPTFWNGLSLAVEASIPGLSWTLVNRGS